MINASNEPCPKCGAIGSLRRDSVTTKLRCSKCKQSNLSLAPQPTPKPTPRKRVYNKYPPIPDEAEDDDIVEMYTWKETSDGRIVKDKLVGVVYCPIHYEKDDSPFDPDEPWAQFALWLYQKRFKNRRRYNHDIIKRWRQQGG